MTIHIASAGVAIDSGNAGLNENNTIEPDFVKSGVMVGNIYGRPGRIGGKGVGVGCPSRVPGPTWYTACQGR